MNAATISVSWLLSALLATSVASAEPEGARIRVEAATSPDSVHARVRSELGDSVKQQLLDAGLASLMRSYTVRPAVIQFRRYVEAGASETKLVCIVDLALLDAEGVLLGHARGSATAVNATNREVIDAAAHSAVAGLSRAFRPKARARKSS